MDPGGEEDQEIGMEMGVEYLLLDLLEAVLELQSFPFQ